MRVKLTDEVNSTLFQMVSVGEIFRQDGNVFMKTDSALIENSDELFGGAINAIHLTNGEYYEFEAHEQVVPITRTFIED